jgi:hypothetical protein
VLLEPAERLGDVAGDRRFLRNDESFAHLLPALLHRARQTCEENLFCQTEPATILTADLSSEAGTAKDG